MFRSVSILQPLVTSTRDEDTQPMVQYCPYLLSKGTACFQSCFCLACLTTTKSTKFKINTIYWKKFEVPIFSNFQEILLKKDHSIDTECKTERPPASATSAAARVSSAQSYNSFIRKQPPAFLISVFLSSGLNKA